MSQYYISLEDHFLSEACEEVGGGEALNLKIFPTEVSKNFSELGPRRISAMDDAKVQIQVISHAPLIGDPSVCRRANEQLRAAVRKYPQRFQGFAMLPVCHPSAAATELRYCVENLGFLGALIPNHAEGTYYDDPKYHSLFQTAEDLEVPLYIHPTPPHDPIMAQYAGHYPEDVHFNIAAHAWGWHTDCGAHFIRLYAAGIFEKFPKLKIILGHLGEMLPFMLDRVHRKLSLSPSIRALSATIKEVYARNIWITTSGMYQVSSLVCALACTSPDRIMYSIDYPFEDNLGMTKFMDLVKSEGILTEAQADDIAHRNAEKLLGIQTSSS